MDIAQNKNASSSGFWLAAKALIIAAIIVRVVVGLLCWPTSLDTPELYYGTIAREFRNGPVLSLFEYQASPQDGGALLLGGLLVIIFSILGPSYAALRLLGPLCEVVSIILWAVIVKRTLGRRVALWFLGMVVLLPPELLRSSLEVSGKWLFPTIINALGLLFLIEIVDRKRRSHTLGESNNISAVKILWVLGFVLSIGSHITNYTFIMFVYSVALLMWLGVFWSLGNVLSFATGVLIGSIPKVACNISLNYWTLGELRWGRPGDTRAFFHTAGSLTEWLWENFLYCTHQFINLVLYWWPQSWTGTIITHGFLRIILGRMYEVLFFSGIAIALLCLRRCSRNGDQKNNYLFPRYRDEQRGRAYIIFFYFAFAIFVTCLSRTGIVKEDFPPYRYIMPLLPFYILALAIFFDRLTLCSHNTVRLTGWTIMALLLSLLMVGNRPLLYSWRSGFLFRQKGYNYSILGHNLGVKKYIDHVPNTAFVLAEKVRDRQDRDDLAIEIADTCWFIPLHERVYPQVNKGLCSRDKGGKHYETVDVEEFKNFAEKMIRECYWPLVYRGLGRGITWSHDSNFQKISELVSVLKARYAWWVWQGVGSIEASGQGLNAGWLLPTLTKIPGSAHKPFCEGVGAFWGFSAREQGHDLEKLLRSLPENVREDCVRGVDLGFSRHPFEPDL